MLNHGLGLGLGLTSACFLYAILVSVFVVTCHHNIYTQKISLKQHQYEAEAATVL